MSLLSVVQGVARRCNYVQPSSVIGNSDPNVQLMLDCVQDTGDDLIERWGWERMKQQTPVSFTGDGATAAWPLPADWQTLSPTDTFVSSAYVTLRMPGPTNEEDLVKLKALSVALYPSCWRVVGGAIEFYPVLQSGEVVTYVYSPNSWVANSSGVIYTTPAPVADTDTFRVPERLLRLGAIWRWKNRKGFAYEEEMQDFELAFARQAGQEGTTRTVETSPQVRLDDDGFFPGTITDMTSGNF